MKRQRYTKKDWLDLLLMFLFLCGAVVVLSLMATGIALMIFGGLVIV